MFFGGMGPVCAASARSRIIKIRETLCWYKHDLVLHETI